MTAQLLLPGFEWAARPVHRASAYLIDKVWAALRWFGRSGDCFPRIIRICERVYAKRRAVELALRELRERGWVEVQRRGRRSSRYLLHGPSARAHPSPARASTCASGGPAPICPESRPEKTMSGHGACASGEAIRSQPEPAPAAPAPPRAQRHRKVIGDRWEEGTSWFRLRKGDLGNALVMALLCNHLIACGRFTDTERDRLRFWAAVAHARRKVLSNGAGLLNRLIRRGLWHFITNGDEAAGRAMRAQAKRAAEALRGGGRGLDRDDEGRYVQVPPHEEALLEDETC